MKVFHFLIVFTLISSCNPTEIEDFSGDSDLSVMSFNLRYDEPADGENKWSNRKASCITMLNEVKPTVFGIQEGLHNQVSYLNDNLPNYNYVGVGRDDGHSSGEYAAIFYDETLVELIDSGDFWLSETPEYPSLGWDANNVRICTWAKLRDINKNKDFYVFNTHFDHKGKTAQKESSKLIVQKIQDITEPGLPVFITGDFNMLIGNSRLEPITTNYFSAQRFAERSDDNKSYNAFGLGIISRNIDFIFYNNSRAISYKTLVKNYGAPYISDHYPIITHFKYQ
ncbi:endonuclease/exonuclease/phosphatase family protein [Flagellimonas marinaquae]